MVTSTRNIFFVIVAAGNGSRFGTDIPKQFLPLAEKPVLLHSIETTCRTLPDARIVLVLSESGKEYWTDISRRYGYETTVIVLGGATRTDSVRNALRACNNLGCSDGDIIMVHDAARPMMSPALLMRMAEAMATSDAAVPVTPLTDSILEVESTGIGRGVDRNRFRAVQTPQAFHAGLLVQAYRKAESTARTYTDDASVVEAFTGCGVTLVEGDFSNIKITNPGDIRIAEILLNREV